MARRATKRRQQGAGSIRRLPSGRYQARYRDADGIMHSAPTTFDAKQDAVEWLDDYLDGDVAPVADDPTLREYATRWLAERDLAPKTRSEYRRNLPAALDGVNGGSGLGDVRLSRLTAPRVRTWYASLNAGTPRLRAAQYALLRVILNTAVLDGAMEANPCQIKGAGRSKRRHTVTIATPSEIDQIAAAMPAKMRALIFLAAYTQLRFGEITELRRRDVDIRTSTLRVRRGVTRIYGDIPEAGYHVGTPKTDAGVRDVGVPTQVVRALAAHLLSHVEPGADALLFTAARDRSRQLAQSSFAWHFQQAREAVGRPDLREHDLRHTGATILAQQGATTRDLMTRLGHATPEAAMIYQHSTAERDAVMTAALDALIEANRPESDTA